MYEAQSFAVLKPATTTQPCTVAYDWWLMLFMSPRDMRRQAAKQQKAEGRYISVPTGKWVVKSEEAPLTEQSLIEYHGNHGSFIGHVAGVRITEEDCSVYERVMPVYEILVVPGGTTDMESARALAEGDWLPLEAAYDAHMLHEAK